METLFPVGDTISSRDTRVLLLIESSDQIHQDPWKITTHIRLVLRKECRAGHVSFRVLVANGITIPDKLLKQYMEAGFYVQAEKDNDAKDNIMFMDTLFWASRNLSNPGNLLVISENANSLGQGKKFLTLRKKIESKGFKVTVTQLEPVMKVQGFPQRTRN